MSHRCASRQSFSLPKPLYFAVAIFALTCLAEAADSGKVTSSKVADGVYLFTTTRYGDVGFGGNAVAILTEDGVVMFDTSGTPSSAQAMLAELRKLTSKPVLYVINSHWHWDHWGGNQVFKEAYPNVQFLSSAKNRDLMMNTAVAWNKPGLERDLPNYIAQQKQQLAAAEAKHAPQSELAEMRELLAADEDFLQQKRSVIYTFPNVVFSVAVTLFMHSRVIRVLHARAITPVVTYVYLPKEKILITGDILVNPFRLPGGSYPQDWIETRKRSTPSTEAIIPGHGEVERDKTYLRQNLTLFRHVASDVQKRALKGARRKRRRLRWATTPRFMPLKSRSRTAPAGLQSLLPEVFVNRTYHELEKPLGDSPTS